MTATTKNYDLDLRELHELHRQLSEKGVLITLQDLREVRNTIIKDLNITK